MGKEYFIAVGVSCRAISLSSFNGHQCKLAKITHFYILVDIILS